MRAFAYWLTLLLIFVIPWENAWEIEGVGTISKAVGLLLAVVWGGTVLATGEIRKPGAFHIITFVFIAWNSATLFWTDHRETTLMQILLYVQLGGLVMIIWDMIRSASQVRDAMHAYVWGCCVTVGAVMYNFQTGAGSEMDRYTAAEGFNANIVAVIITLGMPIAWYLAMTTPKGAYAQLIKGIYFGYLPVSVLAVMLTGSRGGLVALVPALFYVMAHSRLRHPAVRVMFVGGLACGLALVPLILPKNTEDRLRDTADSIRSGEMGGRTALWQQSVPIFLNNSLAGIGVGAFEAEHPSRIAPHNVVLSVVIETGLVGLTILLLLVGSVVYDSWNQPVAQKVLWITVLLVLAISSMVRNLEDRKQTWLVLAMASAAAHVRPVRRNQFAVATRDESREFETPGVSAAQPVTL